MWVGFKISDCLRQEIIFFKSGFPCKWCVLGLLLSVTRLMECPGSCTLHLVFHLEEVAKERNRALAKLLFNFLSPRKHLFSCVMCVCCLHVRGWLCTECVHLVPVYLCVCRLEAGVGIFLNHSLPRLLRQGFSLSLELINWAGLETLSTVGSWMRSPHPACTCMLMIIPASPPLRLLKTSDCARLYSFGLLTYILWILVLDTVE